MLIRIVGAIAVGLAGFGVTYLLLTGLLVAMTPPDVDGARRVAGLVATLVLPAAIALWLVRAVAPRASGAGSSS